MVLPWLRCSAALCACPSFWPDGMSWRHACCVIRAASQRARQQPRQEPPGALRMTDPRRCPRTVTMARPGCSRLTGMLTGRTARHGMRARAEAARLQAARSRRMPRLRPHPVAAAAGGSGITQLA
jgi:hypothetical protein